MNTVSTILVGLLLFVVQFSFGQIAADSTVGMTDTEGTIRVVAEPSIDAMVEEHVSLNRGEAVLAGYRIQLISSPEMNRVRNAQATFSARYPSYSTKVVHESPNFKLRVGGFADRFKAYQALQEVLPSYSGAFIVKDLVRVSEL